MARRNVKLNLAVDKWEMGWGAMPLGWAGWGEEIAHGIYEPFPLLCCPDRKKREMEIMSEDTRESQSQRS